MNTVKISILSVLLVLSQVSEGMQQGVQRVQNLLGRNTQPKTTAGQMRDALRGFRKEVKTTYEQTKQQALDNTMTGEVIGLRQELKGLIGDLGGMGDELQGMAQDLQGVADVTLEVVEDTIKKTDMLGKKSKLKKQVLDVITDVRVIAPTLITAGLAAYLGYIYVQQQTKDQTGVDGFFTNQWNKLCGNIAKAELKAKWGTVFPWFFNQVAQVPVVTTEKTVPTVVYNIPSEHTWKKWFASFVPNLGT